MTKGKKGPTKTDIKKMSLKEKLFHIAEEVKYLEKKRKNNQYGYNFVSEVDTKKAFKPKFNKYRVLFLVSETDRIEYTTKPNSKMLGCTVKGTIYLIDLDSDDKFELGFLGDGSDPSDKGSYKALSAGVRHWLLTNFLIATGDDPESFKDEEDNEEPEEVPKEKQEENVKHFEKKFNAKKKTSKPKERNSKDKVDRSLLTDEQSKLLDKILTETDTKEGAMNIMITQMKSDPGKLTEMMKNRLKGASKK